METLGLVDVVVERRLDDRGIGARFGRRDGVRHHIDASSGVVLH